MQVSRQTLCYVFRPGDRGQQQVLLGRKKRGFGAGKIMGLGGHAEPGESDIACALREVYEEAGITIVPESVTQRAALTFIFPARPELNALVIVFIGKQWSGQVQESDEITPEWFDVASPPLDQMWDDDQYWLPRVLAGESLVATITYDQSCTLVTNADLTVHATRQREDEDSTRPRLPAG